MSFLLLLNTKKDILKNVCNQTVDSSLAIDFHSIFFPTMEVNGFRQLSGYQHSSKYLLFTSTEERNSYRFGTTYG